MPNSDRPNELTGAHYDNALLYAVICDIQQIGEMLMRRQLEEPESTDIPALKAEQLQATEQLWNLLREELTGVACGWAYKSGMAHNMRPDNHPSYQTQQDVVDALTKVAFGYVLEALSHQQIDPNNNILGLAITIAKRKLKLEHKIYSRSQREWEPSSGDDNQRFAEEVADPHSDIMYEQLITAMADSAILAAIREFWKNNLKAVDRLIIDYYLAGETTPTSEEIAKQMGPGWTQAAVRQRLHRIIKATQEYLQGMGCAEFANIEADRLDKPTVELLRTPTARQFWEQELKPKVQKTIRCCIEPKQTPTYQQVAEHMGERGGARQIRERVKKAVEEIRGYLDENQLDLYTIGLLRTPTARSSRNIDSIPKTSGPPQ